MSIYQRGENWYIDFVYKGQRVRESIGPSRKTAEKVINKRKTEIAENRYLDVRKDPDPIPFHEFGVEYWQWAKRIKKPSTCAREIYILRLFDQEFEGKTLQDITTWEIDKWKGNRKAKGLKPASVNRELTLLKHMFSMAVKWGKVKENPTRDVRRFKGETKRVRYLMPDEVQILISKCGNLLDGLLKNLVTVAVHTGARRGELLGLKWDQVDFDQGIITLTDTKNHDRRDIPMDETVKSTLRGMIRRGELVFATKKGRRLEGAFLHKAFHVALDEAGIEDFRFHDLRHTFASNLVMQEGVDLNDVRELLGHKKMDMTLRYAHLSPKHKAKVINILDRVMSQIPPQAGKVVQLRP